MTQPKTGLTLLEMLVVLAVLAVLAGLVVPMLSGSVETAQRETTRASMAVLAKAIMGGPDGPGFVSDVGRMPDRLGELLANPPQSWADPSGPRKYPAFDPNSRRGWHGPYLQTATTRYLAASVYASGGDPGPTSPLGAAYCDAANPQGDAGIADAWFVSAFGRGQPIVLLDANTPTARLVSAGPDGLLGTDDDIIWPLQP